MKQQTYYEFLLDKQASGELRVLFDLGFPTSYLFYMDIYAYHLAHPEASQWAMALEFNTSKRTVYRALHKLSPQIEPPSARK